MADRGRPRETATWLPTSGQNFKMIKIGIYTYHSIGFLISIPNLPINSLENTKMMIFEEKPIKIGDLVNILFLKRVIDRKTLGLN